MHLADVCVKVSKVIYMKNKLKGIASLVLATVIWGSAFIAQSIGMDYIGPFTFQAVRCFMAVIGLLVTILIADCFQKDGKNFFSRWRDAALWKAGALCAVPLFLAVNLQQVALVSTDAGKSAFLTAMYIVLVPIIGIFLRRKTSPAIIVSVILAVAGLYCLSCIGAEKISVGDLCLILCAFMFAVQITVVDHYAPHVDCLRLNLLQSLFCAIFSTIIMLIFEKPDLQAISMCVLPLSYAGFLSMGAAYSLQIYGQKHIASAPASVIMSMESVFATIFGAWILHESMTPWETLGCVLMFIAVLIAQIPPKNKPA